MMSSAFNSSLETGIRSLTILIAAYPTSYDIQRLVHMDYLVVHSGDVDGPKSLHAPLPLRGGELLVRRELIQQGLLLMMSRELVDRRIIPSGIEYQASELASSFLAMQTTAYSQKLKERAEWIVNKYQDLSTSEVQQITNEFLTKWDSEFQPVRGSVNDTV
jgi:hypothetical protein